MSDQIRTPTTLLSDLAHGLLHECESILVDNSLDLPGHRFVSWHKPADDCCDHLVVHVERVLPARATRRTRQSARSTSAGISIHETSLLVTWIGCAAVGDPIPTDAVIDENSSTTLEYAWTLYQGIACFFDADALTEAFGEGCRLISMEQLAPTPPIGGCQRIEIRITVQLS